MGVWTLGQKEQKDGGPTVGVTDGLHCLAISPNALFRHCGGSPINDRWIRIVKRNTFFF